MERAAWDSIGAETPLPSLIRLLNERLKRWADLIGRTQKASVLSVTSATTLTTSTDIVLVDTTGGAVTLSTLAPANQFRGHKFWIKRTAGANNITFDPAGSETIDGAASATVNSTIVACDGSNWYSWAG